MINSTCNADEAFNEAEKCSQSGPGTKLALYADSIRQVYTNSTLQARSRGKWKKSVAVTGTLENGSHSRKASMKPFGDVGLDVGQKAPTFRCPDQFGHAQTLESLEGARRGPSSCFTGPPTGVPIAKGNLSNYKRPSRGSTNKE